MESQIGLGNTPEKALKYFSDKMAFTTGPMELDDVKEKTDEFSIIDVRTQEDYLEGHIPGAINIPKGQWAKAEGLTKEKINVVYCYSQVCHLAATACMEFSKQGFAVMELEGGFESWKDHELDIEKGDKSEMTMTGKTEGETTQEMSQH